MIGALIDAGPLAALFDPESEASEHYRLLVATGVKGIRLHTSWPCVTEAAHFLSAPRRWAMFDWLARGGATVLTIDAADLLEMLPAMQQYTQPPRTDMDLADASLYWLAAETGMRTVLTLDVRDFYRYRLPDGSAFEII
jgi:uncharacterized protein